ncbi:MAG: hypothetical protein LWY06_18565 [Firmicutes bacterium]|nr:hypothetical protein [Bacillota bacterium]
MAANDRGVCPFSHDYRQCYEQCALYAAAIGKCSFFVSAMLLEDLQKIAIVSYEKFVREEEKVLREAVEDKES